MTRRAPFKYFRTSRKIIRLAVMLCIRFPLSLRNLADFLHERGIDESHESERRALCAAQGAAALPLVRRVRIVLTAA